MGIGKISYNKLFSLLKSRDMKKTDLYAVISAPSIAKLSRGDNISLETVDKLCLFLNCQPGDIMEYLPDYSDDNVGIPSP